jgi:membrane associated rhomboid family serine protease
MDFSRYPVTLILIIANVIFSFIGLSNNAFLTKTIGWPYYEKRNKQYYRFITSGFLHADWMHLIFNMFTLFFFGSYIEIIFSAPGFGGSLTYLTLYILGLIAADIPSFFKHQNNPNYRSLGASGAVSAVIFAAIVFSPWDKIKLYGFFGISALVYAFLYVYYCIYMSKKNSDNINHDAHLWGSIFGFIFTLLIITILRPDVFPYIINDLKNPSLFGREVSGPVLKYLFPPLRP